MVGSFSGGQIENAVVVRLECIPQIDPTAKELADLPPGWHAWRRSKEQPWVREPNPTQASIDV
jgi:predicted phosphoadenosine phosphosulfate sulfurtransferase